MIKRPWTDGEVEAVRSRYANERTEDIARDLGRPQGTVYQKAYQLGLKKSEAYLQSADACRLRRGDQVGKAFRFEKGFVPWNKGTHFESGGRSIETRFKPGSKPGNWKPIGSERLSKEGYLQRKLTDTGYPPRDWVPVHHILWREAGREIPKGYRLTFKDGDKTHIALDNFELCSFAEMMRRNTYHNYGKEIAALVQLRGRITQQINRRERNV